MNAQNGRELPAHPATPFTLANPDQETFRAVAVLPVGGAAIMGDDTFIPPWAR